MKEAESEACRVSQMRNKQKIVLEMHEYEKPSKKSTDAYVSETENE